MKPKSRFLAVILAVLMLACLLPTAAFAAETPGNRVAITDWTSGTITINASHADDSFDLYQIVDITYDEATNEVTYKFVGAANKVATGSSITIDQYKAYTPAQANEFLGNVVSYIKGTVPSLQTKTAIGGTATFNNLGVGQYLVIGTGSTSGTYVYQLMTATFAPDENLAFNTTVNLTSKSSAPSIEKKTQKDNNWVDKKDVAVGETVTYQLTATVPTYPAGASNKTFTITDTLPDGLSYVANTANPAPTSVNGQVLTWDIDLATVTGSTVTITYNATVTDAILANHSATNTATLTYGYDPYGTEDKTIEDTTTVYTYGIEITKVDETDTNKKLAGAEFKVYKDTPDVEANLVGTITTDANGIAKLDGLALGAYYIVETKAPTGYVLPTGSTTIALEDTDLNGTLDGSDQYTYTVSITNEKGNYTLPQTGGMGTWMFTIGGLVLMAGAVVLLLTMRKKLEAQN